MSKPARFAIVLAGMITVIAFGSRPAYADHAADCSVMAADALALQNEAGLWLAERRVLISRRKSFAPDSPGYAGWLDENKLSGRKMVTLLNRVSEMNQRAFLLTRDSPCAQRADIDAAIVKASNFLTGSARPTPLPPGMCRTSPDMSVAPVPCPAKPEP